MAKKIDEKTGEVVDSDTPEVVPEVTPEVVVEKKILGTGSDIHAQLHLLKTLKLIATNGYPLRNQYNNTLYTHETPVTVGDINSPDAEYERVHILHGLLTIVDHD